MSSKRALPILLILLIIPFCLSEKKTAIDHFGQLLVRAGYNYYGNETMYSGVDGREMEVSY